MFQEPIIQQMFPIITWSLSWKSTKKFTVHKLRLALLLLKFTISIIISISITRNLWLVINTDHQWWETSSAIFYQLFHLICKRCIFLKPTLGRIQWFWCWESRTFFVMFDWRLPGIEHKKNCHVSQKKQQRCQIK